MTTRAADCFDEIGKHLAELRKQAKVSMEGGCAIQNGLPISTCVRCWMKGPNGAHLDCPTLAGDNCC